MEQIITMLVDDVSTALMLIAAQLKSRGYAIESIAVGKSRHPARSCMTLITHGERDGIEQCIKQLKKSIDIHEIRDLTGTDCVKRELALVKVNAGAAQHEIMHLGQVFEGKVVDITRKSITIEITGISSKVDAFVELLRPYGLLGVIRSGRVVMQREEKDRMTMEEMQNGP